MENLRLIKKFFTPLNILNMSKTEFVRWNRIPLSIPNPSTIWGSSIAPKVSFSADSFTCLNEARFILNISITVNGTASTTWKVNRPAISWINNANLNLTYLTDDGAKTIVYNSIAGRGDAGYLLEVCDLNYAQYLNNSKLEFLDSSTNAVSSIAIGRGTFDVAIPLRYLFSPFAHKRFLPLMDATFNLTFRQLLEIFSPPNNVTSGYTITLNQMHLHFPSYKFASVPRMLTQPINEDIFIQTHDLPAGSNSISGQLNVPGKPKKIFYVMGNSTASVPGTTTTDGVYTLVSNADSLVRSHSFKLGGNIYPLDQDYNSKYEVSSNVVVTDQGPAAFYHEFQVITNSYMQDRSSIVSYDLWLSKYRIYAIDTYDTANTDTTFTFNIQFIKATGAASRIGFVVIYEPSVQPTMSNQLTIT